MVSYLLEQGASPSIPDKDGFTPLHNSSHGGFCSTIRVLVKGGADMQAGKRNYTPLHAAARCGQMEAVQLLVELGADTTARTNYNDRNAEQTAAEYGHQAIVHWLRKLSEGTEHISTWGSNLPVPKNSSSVLVS
mmetsp:Transcript_48391/g.80285  ORF Transcript_48391/g.80285 Transcript_48391/m.80285 type:complete len:134 (+) Transcript_48391:3642-4043(+)